jgi:hypothetical protein
MALAVVAAAALGASSAEAELSEQGNLFVRFQGGIDPTALPRTERAPIAVEVSGTVKTLSGEEPPALRGISIELNRGGTIDSRGLPDCHYGELVAATPARAMAACGRSLVGKGAYKSKTTFPEQSAFPTEGDILAFSGVYEGHEAILAHVYGDDPVPVNRVVVFRIRHSGGTFGTILTGELPDAINPHGYVVAISLRLFRSYVFHGRRRSYISAACAAPVGFSIATFPFARTSMVFADGRTLSSTLTRSCRVSD